MDDAANYHFVREVEERLLASHASNDLGRDVHSKLADRHAQMALSTLEGDRK